MALVREAALQKLYLRGEALDTIYFGGGTPSILDVSDIQIILDAVYGNFTINSSPEITLEANPDDLTRQKLIALRNIGINRLSIGIQSFNDDVLKLLNRAHSSEDAINCLKNARKVGFDNLSFDLIFAIPGSSKAILEKDIDIAMEYRPEHLSAYSLTVEEKTVFGNWYKKGKFKKVDEDETASQFDFLISRLEQNEYDHYEISNFCRDQNYARHNTSYWKNIKYLGIGPGAHSYNGESRQFNIDNNAKYLKSISQNEIPYEIEMLDEKARINEFLLTSLRTKWGCNLLDLKTLFDFDIMEEHSAKLSHLERAQLIKLENDVIYLTRKGKFIADDIILSLFKC